MLFHPHLVFLPRWLLAAALLRPGESPRRSWTPLSTAGRFYATTGLHLPRASAPSPPLSARDPSPPPSPLLMTASPTREPSPNLTAGDSSVHQDQEPLSSTPRSADQEAANIFCPLFARVLLPVDALPEPDRRKRGGFSLCACSCRLRFCFRGGSLYFQQLRLRYSPARCVRSFFSW